MGLRVAVLAPISWRTPPRHYGPWELFASLLTEGLVARGHRRDAVRDRRLVTRPARLQSVVPARLVGGPRRRPEGRGVPPHLRGLRAGRRVRRHPQQLRLPAADLQRPRRHARGDDDPRLLVGADPPGLRSKYNATAAYVAISDADRHPDLDYVATIHHGIDTDAFALHPEPGGYLLFFGRIHPDKGTAEAIEVAAPGRAAAGDRRHRPGPAVLRRAGRAPTSTATASATSARSPPNERSAAARRRARAAPPDRLRRALRLQRRRGDGLRHAGDRVRPRLDARAHRRRRHGLHRRRPRTRRPRPFPSSAASTGPPSARRRSAGSVGTAWSTVPHRLRTDRRGPGVTRPQSRGGAAFFPRGTGLTSKLSTSPTVRSRVIASRNGRWP